MGPGDLFDAAPGDGKTPAGMFVSVTDTIPTPGAANGIPIWLGTGWGYIVPQAPFEPNYLVLDTGAHTMEYGVTGSLTRTAPDPTTGNGYLWTYNWNTSGGPGNEYLEAAYRALTPVATGGLVVTVTGTTLDIGIDTTGWAAGDLVYFNGTEITNFKLDDGSGSTSPVAANEPLRIIRGDVNDDGTTGHGNIYNAVPIWTSSKTALGRYSVSFSYAFPDVPAVVCTAPFNVVSQRSRVINFTTPPATGGFAIAVQEFDGTTQQFVDIDVAFHFIATGLNGNY